MIKGIFRQIEFIRTSCLLALLIMFVAAMPASAHEVLAVKSADIKPYNDAFEGFKKTCGCSVVDVSLPDLGRGTLANKASSVNADAVLAIGMDALKEASSIRNIPVYYTLVPSHPEFALNSDNMSGINMMISAERQVEVISKVFPKVRSLGIIYDPDISARLVRDISHAAKKKGLEIIARAVHRPNELPVSINGMKGSVDLFWMLPDVNIINSENLGQIFLFSFQNKVPVFTFSKKYLDMGSVAAVVVDPEDLGRQAGNEVKTMLSNAGRRQSSHHEPKKFRLMLNRKMAEKLNVHINDHVREGVMEIE